MGFGGRVAVASMLCSGAVFWMRSPSLVHMSCALALHERSLSLRALPLARATPLLRPKRRRLTNPCATIT